MTIKSIVDYINKRVRDIADFFGTDSAEYQREMHRIDVLFGDIPEMFTKSGRLTRGKTAQKYADKLNTLHDLMESDGGILRQINNALDAAGYPSVKNLRQAREKWDDIRQAARENYENQKKGEDLYTTISGDDPEDALLRNDLRGRGIDSETRWNNMLNDLREMINETKRNIDAINALPSYERDQRQLDDLLRKLDRLYKKLIALEVSK